MPGKRNILVIIGSASKNSANEKLIDNFVRITEKDFRCTIGPDLKTFPHFDPELSINNPSQEIVALRKAIEQADGVLICTPEYVFSIPSGLKNAIEWCVATTVFSDKPTGLITASAHGQSGHQELQLIMKTLMARFTNETTLLIQGVKGKIDDEGKIIDSKTMDELVAFIEAYKILISQTVHTPQE